MSLTMVRRRSMLDLRQVLPMVLLALAVMLSSLLPALTPQPIALPAASILSPDTAIDLAITPAGVDKGAASRLELFHATFQPSGITFQPRFGGAPWSWSLTEVSAGGRPLADVSTGVIAPTLSSGQADYARGALVERYITRSNAAIEQQFIIPAPLALGGQDLTVRGAINAHGAFSAIAGGWAWRTDEGAVTLGEVAVFDASGAALPATMQVTADSSTITVDGAALASAAYPVTIDPLIGTDDFAITSLSSQAGNLYDAMEPAAAYDPENNRYLVVFSADGPVDSNPALQRLNEEFEIYGQFVDAATGALDGAAFRISRIGNDLATDAYDAISPDVAYSSRDKLFLVTWAADNSNPPDGGLNTYNGFEIYTQVVSSAGDLLIREPGDDPAVPGTQADRPKDDRISNILAFTYRADLTPDDGIANTVVPDWDAFSPSVGYNSTNGDFMVCWSDDRLQPLATPTTQEELLGGRYEIRCKRFIMDPPADNSRPFFGAEPTSLPRTYSGMRPVGSITADAYTPDVAYNSVDNVWLIVWSGDDIASNQLDDEFEIFGQFVAATGVELTATPYRNDHRFTQLGGEVSGDANAGADVDAYYPAVAYNPDRNQFLVAFTGDAVNGAEEVYSSLRTRTGSAPTFGVQQARLSEMGGTGTSGTAASLKGLEPDVAYDAARKEWMVVWRGDGTTNDVFQIYGQRLDATTPTDAEMVDPNSPTLISEVGDLNVQLGSARTIIPTSTNNQGLNDKYLLSGTSSTNGEIVFDGQPLSTRLSMAPALAASGTGDYLVVWTGNSTAVNTGTGTQMRLDIRGRLMSFNETPVVTPPANITTEATGPSGAVVTYSNATATDAEDGALTATCTPASGGTFAIGVTTVTCTATDSIGKQGTATFTITVADTTAPTISNPGNQSAEATSTSGAVVTFTAPAASDTVDGAITPTCVSAPTAGLSSGSTFPIGVTTITCDASDAADNAAPTIVFTVTVADTIAPTITVPDNISEAATSASGAVVTFTAPSASDAVDGAITPTCVSTPTAGLSSGSTFPVGTTTITCNASDTAGNAAAPQSFTVTVGAFNAQANLGLSRSLTPDPVQAGKDLTASFTISNAGPQAATGVELIVPVPSSVTFKSGTSGCVLDGSTVKCAAGTIANGASKTISIVFTVKANATGSITISGTVSAAETDPVGTNNSGSGSVTVAPAQAPNKIYLPILNR